MGNLAISQWSTGKVRQVGAVRSAYIYACSKGQYGNFVAAEGSAEGFSVFSRALSMVAHPDHAARTVREVLDAVQEEINRLLSEHQIMRRQAVRLGGELPTNIDSVVLFNKAQVVPPTALADYERSRVALPTAPPWRMASTSDKVTYITSPYEDDVINAALELRKPLLVTGRRGSGKTSLAYAVAERVNLGPVLRWKIHRHSTLREGLYHYDRDGQHEDTTLHRPDDVGNLSSPVIGIGNFIRLGPLGTALLPQDNPRLLLIDDLDNSDGDLPDELLTVLEAGEFEIPELARLATREQEVVVSTDDGKTSAINNGHVRCSSYPVVIITSNWQNELSPALTLKCIRLQLSPPSVEKITYIVAARFGPQVAEWADQLIRDFAKRSEQTTALSLEQLFDVIHLIQTRKPVGAERDRLVTELLRPLDKPATY